ncbi:hypothetical protein HYC85_008354 [Camellia sinensis]|uniref:Uncharacterized protein n=1 Tax=Camellia sinensis TaxID=4442 RepID=A0A7J7HU02_CAMSI|nr:hypothetical protein HYC85_008354 [Camellia sinensis]
MRNLRPTCTSKSNTNITGSLFRHSSSSTSRAASMTHNKHQCPTQIYDMMITGMDSSIEASLSARERNIGGSKERRETIVAKEIRRAKAFGTVILIARLERQVRGHQTLNAR